MSVRTWVATRLRYAADRLDDERAPRRTHWTFTFECDDPRNIHPHWCGMAVLAAKAAALITRRARRHARWAAHCARVEADATERVRVAHERLAQIRHRAEQARQP